MADLRRLLDEGATEFEARLLSSAKDDGPSPASRHRIVAGLGVGLSPALMTSGVQAGHFRWLRRIVERLKVSWPVGAGIAAAAVAAAALVDPPSFSARGDEPSDSAPAAPNTAAVAAPPSEAPSSPEDSSESAAAPTPDASESVTEESSPAARPASRRAPARASRDADGEQASALSQELALLDAARAAIAQGNPRRALRLLDEHGQRFTKPRLPTEASVLRIEALVRSGDRAQARKLGEAFLARHVNGPYERRVRSLIGDAKRPGS